MKIPYLSELKTSERTDLFKYLRTSITHHSNAIEGVSLTYGETKRLLEEGFTAPDKPLSDHLITLGFANAYDSVVLEGYGTKKPLTTNYIKDLHAMLFKSALLVCSDKIERPIGAYRVDERRISGLAAPLASPREISNRLENLIFLNKTENLYEIAQFHIDFELIHPFTDGNGRLGRLLITYQCIQNDLIPPLIENEQRTAYLDSLNNPKVLESFLEQSQKVSYEKLLEIIRSNEQDFG